MTREEQTPPNPPADGEAAAVRRRRGLPAEAWLGLAALVVCAGAWLGPGTYRRVVVGRMLAAMGDDFTRADFGTAGKVMALGWPEADEGLRRFADRSPLVAWLPGERALVSAPPGMGFRLGLPPGAPARFLSAPTLSCCIARGESFERCLVGAEVVALAAAGDRVEVHFRLDEAVAERLKLTGDRTRCATLTLGELRRAAYGGSTVMADYDVKSPDRIWREVLAGLAPLLRAAGVQTPE